VKVCNYFSDYRVFCGQKPVAHPTPSRPVPANVWKPTLVIPIRSTERYFLYRLINDESLDIQAIIFNQFNWIFNISVCPIDKQYNSRETKLYLNTEKVQCVPLYHLLQHEAHLQRRRGLISLVFASIAVESMRYIHIRGLPTITNQIFRNVNKFSP
jgi:hypothetical protein